MSQNRGAYRQEVMRVSASPDPFDAHRERLFGLAYRMLGVRADAEDIVQEAFVRWHSAGEVREPGAFLTRVVTHLCLDEMKSARRRREAYVGPWLPEPIETAPDPAHAAELADSLSFAFLRLLDALAPPERAVFLLREVFGLDYDEVAEAVGVTLDNARQMAHRARQRVQGPPRFDASLEERDRLLDRFQQAAEAGDLGALVAFLAEDVALYADGGGKRLAAGRPLHGPAEVVRFVGGLLARYGEGFDALRRTHVNGEPAVVFSQGGEPTYVWTFHIGAGRIQGLYVVGNPDKLGGIART